MMSIRCFLTSAALAALTSSWLASAPAQAQSYKDVINPADPTFNQLLGINNSGLITGYFGIGGGVAGHPNQGYTYSGGVFTPTNFPGSAQTQVTGLNNTGTLVGFWAPTNVGGDANYGFYKQSGGPFITVVNPNTTSTPPVNQLLGVNDSNVAVGFFNDSGGNSNGYTYNITTGNFIPVNDPSGVSTTAAGINNAGNIVGFYTKSGQTTSNGFLDIGGNFTTLDAPGATSTMLLGINNKGLIVGTDTDANGMHGVIYNELTQHWTVLNAYNNTNFTTLNGVNDLGQIVGFYTKLSGNGDTIGLLVNSPAPEMGRGVLGLALLVLVIATRRFNLLRLPA